MRTYRDPWAERIAALAWPLIIPITVVLWQRWLERVIPTWLEQRDAARRAARSAPRQALRPGLVPLPQRWPRPTDLGLVPRSRGLSSLPPDPDAEMGERSAGKRGDGHCRTPMLAFLARMAQAARHQREVIRTRVARRELEHGEELQARQARRPGRGRP